MRKRRARVHNFPFKVHPSVSFNLSSHLLYILKDMPRPERVILGPELFENHQVKNEL